MPFHDREWWNIGRILFLEQDGRQSPNVSEVRQAGRRLQTDDRLGHFVCEYLRTCWKIHSRQSDWVDHLL